MYSSILARLVNYPIIKIQIGVNWTAVVVDKEGEICCGLASTLIEEHNHSGEPDIPSPGSLENLSAMDLANWILADIPLRRSIGCATINALLPQLPASWTDKNAETAMLEHGRGKKVVLIGHFPFVKRVRDQLGQLDVLDMNPAGADLPASAAPMVLPDADLVAITGMAFINHTLPNLLELCRQDAYVILLGPSTPLTPIWKEYGVDLLAGAIVEDIPGVLNAIGQGATFRQLHKIGVRLVTQETHRES
jgi:uncharacterized protein (DUF4213/DUF364 family)